ncbi:MAG: outer membrane homotrimeric porin [Desulfovibrionaceae bacterium]|nr:outer membrane homotrimeric porin [Desulfovibrionaceae bacterium]
MKKLLILLAAMTLVFGAVSQAGAAVKFGATGNWQHQFTYAQNVPSFNSDAVQDNLYMYNRANITFTVEANENIKANTMIRIGAFDWGRHNGNADGVAGGGTMAQRGNLQVRQAFISAKFPGTPLTLDTGVMPLAFPAAALGNNPVLNDRYPAIVLGFPVGDVGKAALVYSRPYRAVSGLGNIKNGTDANDKWADYNSVDAIAALADLNFGTFSLAPYLAYVKAGHKAGIAYYRDAADTNEKDTTAIVLGAAFKISPIQNLNIGFDAIYGSTSNGTDKGLETKGFLVGLAVDYKLDFGTPGFFAWYGSGNKKDDVNNDNKYGVLPLIGPDGGIAKMRFATNYTPRILEGNAYNVAARNGVGTMGLGLQLANVKSMDKLSHTFRIGYIVGTSDKEVGAGFNRLGGTATRANNYAWVNAETIQGLSKDYSLIEFDIENTLKIVDNLDFRFDLGILAPSIKDKDKKTPGAFEATEGGKVAADTGFVLDLALVYNF